MSRLILPVYAGLATVGAPLLRVMLRLRLRRGKEIAARLAERRGIEGMARPAGRLIWLHAASMGETMSILPVVAELVQLSPATTVLVTTGTVTSAALFARRAPALGGRVLHRFVPLDVPGWVGRFLDHWRPDAAAMVESELWPNMLAACRRRRVRLMLINGRMSDRSYRRWRLLPRVIRPLLSAFTLVQAQSQDDADRLQALGAPQVSTPGNLKFAAPALPVDRVELDRLAHVLSGRPVWLAACTHPGEEAVAIAIHHALAPRHPGLLTIIAPRHAERGADVAGLAGTQPVTRRALHQDPPVESGLWIADTMGELGLLYRLCRIVFVGKSLAVFGGQNPLEPARLGCAVAVGPRTENLREAVALLRASGGLTVVEDGAGLRTWVEALLSDPARTASLGQACAAAAQSASDLPQRVARALAVLAGAVLAGAVR
jgi:3-deoxy-D-manno-octulosonic-acid transferase